MDSEFSLLHPETQKLLSGIWSLRSSDTNNEDKSSLRLPPLGHEGVKSYSLNREKPVRVTPAGMFLSFMQTEAERVKPGPHRSASEQSEFF